MLSAAYRQYLRLCFRSNLISPGVEVCLPRRTRITHYGTNSGVYYWWLCQWISANSVDLYLFAPVYQCALLLSDVINTPRPKQNGWHFFRDISKWISLNENFTWFKFLQRLFQGTGLAISYHYFRWLLVAKQAPSHYLNQWWLSVMLYGNTRSQWLSVL